jgi:predicted dehydrogenase
MTVKTAVVGVGLHGQNHALVYADDPNSELLLVCDADADRAAEVADRFQCRATDRLEDVLQSDVQAVSVATPDAMHFDPAVALLRAGKHVLLEKPMTTSVGQAEALVEAAELAGVNLMINFSQRWNPKHLAVKERILAGDLGQILVGYARLSNDLSVPRQMLKWSGQSGPEWFLFPHSMDVVTWLIGQSPREVFATGIKRVNRAEGRDVYDAIQAQVRYDAAVVTFETAWLLPEGGPRVADSLYHLVGSHGWTSVSAEDGVYGTTRAATGLRAFDTVPLARANAYGKVAGFYFESIRHFVASVGVGSKPLVAGRDGLLNVRMIAATLESIQTGAVVSIGPIG